MHRESSPSSSKPGRSSSSSQSPLPFRLSLSKKPKKLGSESTAISTSSKQNSPDVSESSLNSTIKAKDEDDEDDIQFDSITPRINTLDTDGESMDTSENSSEDEYIEDSAKKNISNRIKPDISSAKPRPTVRDTNSESKSAQSTDLQPLFLGEDTFSEASVKEWQTPRIKAWESRRSTPETFYFRFVAPGEGQSNGKWSKEEHKCFMDRYEEWIASGRKMGHSWGLFSIKIPHRVGYQCMNYYRRLVRRGEIKDNAYDTTNGVLKHVGRERASVTISSTELGPEWETEHVKNIEKNVNNWIKEFHNSTGRKPSGKSKTEKLVVRRSVPIGDLIKAQPARKRKRVSEINPDEEDFMEMQEDEPERMNVSTHPIDWEEGWKERLENYKDFMKPFLDTETRENYWHAKQRWRQGLVTTEMLLAKKPIQRLVPQETTEPIIKPLANRMQASLSRFFAGVKKLKVDTPEELISNVRIPNDLFSGVRHILPLKMAIEKKTGRTKTIYYEVDDIMDSIKTIDEVLENVPEHLSHQSPLEGVLVDPPWEFYVNDGRNDGRCTWNLKNMAMLMDKILDKMTAGLIFIWTHKLIQADVVKLMSTLGCKYVENLVWFKKSVNNVQLDQPSPYISSAKEILLMFKKGEGFELRHQRSADVIIEFESPREEWIHDEYTEPKPNAVYEMIETLLPKAAYDETLGRGRFLELWSKRVSPKREGWISFHQKKYPLVMTADPQIQDTEMCIKDEFSNMSIKEYIKNEDRIMDEDMLEG